MGLDMYLYRTSYVKNWDFMKPEERWEITAKKGGRSVNLTNVSHLKEEIGYWRKANAIHNWFVTNCADGVDDCRPFYVSRESLANLLSAVNAVLASPADAPKTLPAASGFFFGSTDYDQWYIQDLERTKKILESALESPEDCDFEYRASW